MGKQETVAKYIDAYLKGRSQKSIEKFRAKDINKQYGSIMQWRRKIRLNANTPESARDILNMLRKVKTNIANAPELKKNEIEEIRAELAACDDELTVYVKNQRLRLIKELESQKEDIEYRLSALRGENYEPTLF